MSQAAARRGCATSAARKFSPSRRRSRSRTCLPSWPRNTSKRCWSSVTASSRVSSPSPTPASDTPTCCANRAETEPVGHGPRPVAPVSNLRPRLYRTTVRTQMDDQPREILHSVFGYERFRGPQAEVIGTLMAGGDALVLMPTGGGKSLCYQIPAIARPGTGIVVSPLIALMQDQVAAFKQAGARAEFLNSTLDAAQARDIEAQLLRGELDLLYVAPERLLLDRTLDLLARTRLALFAIDEAHCVSQWGHDFRPEYMGVNVLHQRFPGIP